MTNNAHTHHNGESSPPDPETESHRRRALKWMLSVLVPVALATIIGLIALWPTSVGSAGGPELSVQPGTVVEVREMDNTGSGDPDGLGADDRPGAELDVRVEDGPEAGDEVTVLMQPAVYSAGVEPGDPVLVQRAGADEGSYQFVDFDRSTPLLTLAIAFAALLILVARTRGALSLVGLAFSGFVVLKFMLPALLAGSSPVAVALTAGSAILITVLYVTHGFSARTTTALLGTLAGMVTATAIGWVFVDWANLTGVTSEDDILLWASAPDMNLTGVVICATIITAVGVLNDVTITQASAVWELAGPEKTKRQLFVQAMRIGRDHIASSTYTVAFAATGAALATYLLLAAYDRPLGEVVVLEQFSAEIIATLIGALSVVLAMPLTTALAVLAARPATPRTAPQDVAD